MASRPAAAGQQGEESRLTPAAKSALTAAVISALRNPDGEFDAGYLQRAMDEGLPEQAIRNAAAVACRRDASNREARAWEQQQQMQPQVGPSSSNDATCTISIDKKTRTVTTGTINYSSGDFYEGELKNGKRHGSGICRYAQGAVYDGEWKDDLHHGNGIYTSASGDVYDGEWERGIMQGKGTYRFKNTGCVYEGEWAEGREHGWGTLTWPSGNVHEGAWKEGKLHGKGTLKDATGSKTYEGHWVDGVCQQGVERLEKDSTASEGLAVQIAAPSVPSSRANMGTVAPNTSDNEQPEKEKRIYIERQLRSPSSQQRSLEKCTAFEQSCECCGVGDDQYKLRVCSGCNLALYCSAACQKAASRSHRRICDIISQLPPRNADMLELIYDEDEQNDFDAGLRYATKYMDELKILTINVHELGKNDTAKISAKYLCSLLRSKKGKLDSFILVPSEDFWVPGITRNGHSVWKELHGLKQLRLMRMPFNVQPICDIIGQQKDTLVVLCLPWLLDIDWSKAKSRKSIAQAVGSCKHLVSLNLDGCVLMDSDLKVMLNGLPNLRTLYLTRDTRVSHEFTDNTCGLIARKCPALQELNLDNHDQISVRGIRKIFEGCVHLRSFLTSTHKLSSYDIRTLLEIAPRLLCLTLDEEIDLLDVDIDEIIEVTGGRTLLDFFGGDIWMPHNVSVETREKYLAQKAVWERIDSRKNDCRVVNEWEPLLADDGWTQLLYEAMLEGNK